MFTFEISLQVVILVIITFIGLPIIAYMWGKNRGLQEARDCLLGGKETIGG